MKCLLIVVTRQIQDEHEIIGLLRTTDYVSLFSAENG